MFDNIKDTIRILREPKEETTWAQVGAEEWIELPVKYFNNTQV